MRRLTLEKDKIFCLKEDLDIERVKSKRLEKEKTLLVRGRNQEISELNMTIASLVNNLKVAEANNELLKAIIMHTCSSDHLKPNQHKTSTSLYRPNENDHTNKHDQLNCSISNRSNEHDQIIYVCAPDVNLQQWKLPLLR